MDDTTISTGTPVEREAVGVEMATIEWRGEHLEIPANPEDWPVAVAEQFELGRIVGAVRALLGPGQWSKVERHNLRVRDLNELADLFVKEAGLENLGNS